MIRRPPRSTLLEGRRQRQMCIRDRYRLIREKTLNIGRKDFQGGYENYTFDEDTGEVGYTGQFGLLRRFYHIPYEDYHKDQGYVLIEYDLTKLRAPYIDYENFVKGTTYGHKKESYYIDVKGSRVDTVTSTNRNAYPNDGESGSYWYVYDCLLYTSDAADDLLTV